MDNKDIEFYLSFEKLMKKINTMRTLDIDAIRPETARLCELLRVAKVTSTSYANARLESMDRGERIVAYDSGLPCVEIINDRTITEMMSIISCKIYIAAGAEPWTETERERISLLTQTIAVYVSRTRVIAAAERFAFFDDDGYHNLRYFIKSLQKAGPAGELRGKAAINFNLKHFSLVNQQVGRQSGNTVMQGFYHRAEEIIGDKGFIGRMGGDNFVAVCPGERLDALLEFFNGSPIVYDEMTGDKIMVSASVGIYQMPENFEYSDVGDILDKIIAAVTIAKQNGTPDIVFFNNEMNARKQKASRLQRMFPEALRQEEFKVFYQPKIDIATGELIGAEALCRWFHDGRIIPPSEFIPLLEQGIDICRLDFYMLDHVCRDIRRWLDEGRKVVRVSVNYSRKHMMDIDLLEHTLDIVDRNNVPHRYIEIELTETTTDVEFQYLKSVVSGLQTAGISTSVDDFGMGYSSLNLIKEVPWNVLKIDKSFLPLESDNENSTRSVMFKYVVAMAKELGLECIAEGVETEQQVNVLRQNHCDLAQGFYFDKPLPVEEFEKRLDIHHYNNAMV